jgi:ribosomal protein S18 acetylase RimI-like enzyme
MNTQIIITQLPESSWEQYKAIRLASLKEDPLAFCGTYEKEVIVPEEQWRKQIHNMWFAVSEGQLIGSIALVRKSEPRSQHGAWLYAFWVDPRYRGQGVGKQLLAQAQEVAREQGLRKISLQVTSSQQAAFALYKKMGFEVVGHFKQELYDNGIYYDTYQMEWLVKT